MGVGLGYDANGLDPIDDWAIGLMGRIINPTGRWVIKTMGK